MMYRRHVVVVALLALLAGGACAKKKPPVARPTPPPPASGTTAGDASAGAARAGPGAAAGPAPSRLPPIRWRRRTSTRSTRTRRSSRSSSLTIRIRSTKRASRRCNGNAALMKKYPTWIVTIEGHSRRARHGGVQPGARRAARAGGAELPGVARHPGRPAAHGQLRQGIPVRSRARRGLVVQEPPRAFRRDEQVGVPGCADSGVPGSRFGYRFGVSHCPGPNSKDVGVDEGKTMTRRAWPRLRHSGSWCCRRRPALAADKAHQQLMAEIRMLQEQQQQLQQVLGGLADTLKTITGKIDDQAATSRKSAADQKLLIDNIAEGVRILREKADDTNVRLSTVTPGARGRPQAVVVDARRHPSLSPGQEPAAAASESATAASGTAGAPGAPAPAGAAARPLISPRRCSTTPTATTPPASTTSRSWASRRSSAAFPRNDKADDAQLNIGQSLYGAGQYTRSGGGVSEGDHRTTRRPTACRSRITSWG